jgi:phospholipase C
MRASDTRTWLVKAAACALTFAMSVFGFGAPARAANDPDNAVDAIKTATPIKHVIIIVGENRSFDHLYATYVPTSKKERVLNLLSEGIINPDGSPGPNFAKAHQFQITSAPNGGKFFSPQI